MSRPTRYGIPTAGRERLKYEFSRSAPLRQIYPHLAQVRIELVFKDDTKRAPSFQSFSYFPAARSFFRYACPCHSCSGEFDLSRDVAELAGSGETTERSRVIDIACQGRRAHELEEHIACPIGARILVSAIPRTTE